MTAIFPFVAVVRVGAHPNLQAAQMEAYGRYGEAVVLVQSEISYRLGQEELSARKPADDEEDDLWAIAVG